jgi:transmembrane sensor
MEKLTALEPGDAAAALIMRRAEGLTPSEQRLLADWLAKDEAHRRVFDSADRAWQSFAEAHGDEILKAMRAHALQPRARSFASWRPAIGAAGVLLLAVGAALMLVPGMNPWAPEPQQLGPASATAVQYTTARGEVKNVRLPDGSNMTLDADSIAVGRIGSHGRDVQLQRGRAFFEVMPDQSRPFVVAAAGRSIVAVGTRFDVNLAAGGLTVTLVEGHVNVGSSRTAQAPVTLEPGQQYVERLGTATVRTIGASSENAIAWRVGLLNFDDETLAEAAAVMNRYSQYQIVIHDPAVASMKVSGQFRAGDAQRFAAALVDTHKLRVVRRADEIELLRTE